MLRKIVLAKIVLFIYTFYHEKKNIFNIFISKTL